VHHTATKGIRPSLVTSSSSSLVTACNGCAGSTTAAGKARHRPGERYQGRQNTLPSQPQRKHNTSLHHTPRTAYVLANHQPHTHPAKHFEDQVKHKIKLGASPGGEGQAGPGASQEVKASRRQARRGRPARSKSASTAAVHSHTFAQLQAKVATVQRYHC
jgi:hypothetical protein